MAGATFFAGAAFLAAFADTAPFFAAFFLPAAAAGFAVVFTAFFAASFLIGFLDAIVSPDYNPSISKKSSAHYTISAPEMQLPPPRSRKRPVPACVKVPESYARAPFTNTFSIPTQNEWLFA